MTQAASRPPKRRRPLDALITLSGLSAGLATFLIGLFVAYDVVARTVFLMTNSWVTEITTYLMGYITFVGAAFALREGSHVSVDLLVCRAPPRARRVMMWLADAIMVLVVATLAWLSFRFFMEAWDSQEMSDTLLSVRLWKPYLVFFIGMAWLLLVLILQIGERRLINKQDSHD